MRSNQIQRKPSLLGFLVTAIAIFGAIYYLVVALNTKDALWLWPIFSESPEEILVYCYGETVSLKPDEIDFNMLNNAVNESLTGKKWWDRLTMSRDTFNEYQDSDVMVVVHLMYPDPIRVHTDKFWFSNVNELVIPVIGRHADARAVFGIRNGGIGPGSIHVESMELLRNEVERLEICR